MDTGLFETMGQMTTFSYQSQGSMQPHVPHAGSLRRSILNVEFARGKGMFSTCQFTPEISGMIQARHEIAADRRHPSVTVSRLVYRRFGSRHGWD